MRLKEETKYECFHKVSMIANKFYESCREQYPDIDFKPLYINFTNWIIASMNHPLAEHNMPYQLYCVKHGYQVDMTAALAEFISQCNILTVITGSIDFEVDEYKQKIDKIDYYINGQSVQVKAVVANSRILLERAWFTGKYAMWHSLVDIDLGRHWVFLTEKLIPLVPEKTRSPSVDDVLTDLAEYYFDNSSIFKYS